MDQSSAQKKDTEVVSFHLIVDPSLKSKVPGKCKTIEEAIQIVKDGDCILLEERDFRCTNLTFSKNIKIVGKSTKSTIFADSITFEMDSEETEGTTLQKLTICCNSSSGIHILDGCHTIDSCIINLHTLQSSIEIGCGKSVVKGCTFNYTGEKAREMDFISTLQITSHEPTQLIGNTFNGGPTCVNAIQVMGNAVCRGNKIINTHNAIDLMNGTLEAYENEFVACEGGINTVGLDTKATICNNTFTHVKFAIDIQETSSVVITGNKFVETIAACINAHLPQDGKPLQIKDNEFLYGKTVAIRIHPTNGDMNQLLAENKFSGFRFGNICTGNQTVDILLATIIVLIPMKNVPYYQLIDAVMGANHFGLKLPADFLTELRKCPDIFSVSPGRNPEISWSPKIMNFSNLKNVSPAVPPPTPQSNASNSNDSPPAPVPTKELVFAVQGSASRYVMIFFGDLLQHRQPTVVTVDAKAEAETETVFRSLRRALASAQHGDTLALSVGTWNLKDKILIIKKKITLLGKGENTQIHAEKILLVGNIHTSVKFENLSLVLSHGMEIQKGSHILQNCWYRHFTGYALHVHSEGFRVTIHGTTFNSTEQPGVPNTNTPVLKLFSPADVTENKFCGGFRAIQVISSETDASTVITDNNFLGPSSAIVVEGGRTVIESNIIEGCMEGIWSRQKCYGEWKNNHITHCSLGIDVVAVPGSQIAITNNTIQFCATAAISVPGVYNHPKFPIKIKGNTLRHGKVVGVRVPAFRHLDHSVERENTIN